MIKLITASLSDPGRSRESNEDRVWAQIFEASENDTLGLFIVCDGIGGHMGGEVASQWAVEAVKQEMAEFFCPADPRATVHLGKEEMDAVSQGVDLTRVSESRKMESLVRKSIQKANHVVYRYAQQKPEEAADAGTTITMAFVVGKRAVFGNVGDSRSYLLRNDQLEQITNDHSLVASLVQNGTIKAEDIYTHPQRNLIYRSLGHKQELKVDTFVRTIQSGDHLLLCSDGLWEMVKDESAIVQAIKTAATVEQACKQLIDMANRAGGEDNIGVVVVRVI